MNPITQAIQTIVQRFQKQPKKEKPMSAKDLLREDIKRAVLRHNMMDQMDSLVPEAKN